MNLRKRIKRIFSARYILWNMIAKELKAKYVSSVLGVWWAVITPLLIMVVITFVFTKVINISIENFPLFSLAGIMPWFFLTLALTDSTLSLIQKSKLLKQFTFPSEFIPISSILANFINFLIGLLFMLPVFIFFNRDVLSVLRYLPLVLLLHLLFTVGVGVMLSCVSVFLRDISHVLGVILMFWFWVTPVFYSIDMVPEAYRWVCNLNPMTIYIEFYRSILFRANALDLNTIFIASGVSVLVFLIGYIIFIKCESSFIKRV